MKKVTVTAEIEIPNTPNFLRMADGQTLPISAVGENSLKEIGEAWTLALINKARKQRGGNGKLFIAANGKQITNIYNPRG